MKLQIKGDEVELKFGIGFIRDMDKRKEQEVEGMKFGIGLMLAMESIEQFGSSEALLEVVQSATRHHAEYTIDEIVDALDALPIEEQGSFLEGLQVNLKTSPVVQASYQKMQKVMKEAEQKKTLTKVVK